MAIFRGSPPIPIPGSHTSTIPGSTPAGAVSMFDNGNTRVSRSGGIVGGMVLSIDEGDRIISRPSSPLIWEDTRRPWDLPSA